MERFSTVVVRESAIPLATSKRLAQTAEFSDGMEAAVFRHALTRFSALLIGLAVVGTACGGDSAPMSPSTTPTLAGRWSGDLLLGTTRTRMTWTLTQDTTQVSGPALVLLPSGTVLLNGLLSGTLNGTTLDYTLTVAPGGIPALPSCAGQFGGTVTVAGVPASALDGRFSLISSACAPPVTGGTFTLTRE